LGCRAQGGMTARLERMAAREEKSSAAGVALTTIPRFPYGMMPALSQKAIGDNARSRWYASTSGRWLRRRLA
jgi:hypothetical protein